MALSYLNFTPVNTISGQDVNNAQGAYNSDSSAATTANQNLQNYQQSMQGGTDMYNQQLGGAESSLGFNPADLSAAQNALATTQTTIANLPKAVAQQGNYYGTTAGSEANNMSQASGNLQGLLNGQTNQVAAQGNIYNSALTQANQATQAGQQGQQMQLTALQGIYSNAADQQKTALSQLQNLQNLYQQQGQFNASQQAVYEQANAALETANAAMATSAAQINQLNSQAALYGSQTAGQNITNQSNQNLLNQATSVQNSQTNPITNPYSSPGMGVLRTPGQSSTQSSSNNGSIGNILSNLFKLA